MSTNTIKLQIINDISESNNDVFLNYFNIKCGYLYLSYPSISENTEECWTYVVLKMLDDYKEYDIINNTYELFLETDYYWKFPAIFLRFQNVKKLELAGCRWFELNCNQFSPSIEHLILTDQSNLPISVMRGGESLINLKKIELIITPFFGDMCEMLYIENLDNISDIDLDELNENLIPIPDLGNLMEISLNFYGCGISIEFIENVNIYKNIIIHHKLFENIKYRISDIYIDSCVAFIVKLK